MSDDDLKKGIARLFSSRSHVFSTLIKIVGLDPAHDLRDIDLSYVDFGLSDLRGYDFRGSVLSGSSWLDAIVDETTLYDADYKNLVKRATVYVEGEDPTPGFIRSITE